MRTNRLPVTCTVYLYNVPLKHTNYLLPVQTVLMLHVQTASLPVTHTNSHQDQKKEESLLRHFREKKKFRFYFHSVQPMVSKYTACFAFSLPPLPPTRP